MLRQHGRQVGAAYPAPAAHEIRHNPAGVVGMPVHAVDDAGVRPCGGVAGFDGAAVDVAAPLDAVTDRPHRLVTKAHFRQENELSTIAVVVREDSATSHDVDVDRAVLADPAAAGFGDDDVEPAPLRVHWNDAFAPPILPAAVAVPTVTSPPGLVRWVRVAV